MWLFVSSVLFSGMYYYISIGSPSKLGCPFKKINERTSSKQKYMLIAICFMTTFSIFFITVYVRINIKTNVYRNSYVKYIGENVNTGNEVSILWVIHVNMHFENKVCVLITKHDMDIVLRGCLR